MTNRQWHGKKESKKSNIIEKDIWIL